MAHHNSTPQSVLDAPLPVYRWFWLHTYPNRAMRRAGVPAVGRNRTYVKPKTARSALDVQAALYTEAV